MKLLRIEPRPDDGKRLKAFADVQLDSGIIIRAFRITQEPGKRPIVHCPQTSIKEPNKPAYFKTLVILPDQLKGEVDLIILNAYTAALAREKENGNGPHSLPQA